MAKTKTWRAINTAMKKNTNSQIMKGIVKAMRKKSPNKTSYFMTKLLRKLEQKEQHNPGHTNNIDELFRFARALAHFADNPGTVEPIDEGFSFSYKDFI